MEFLSLQAKGFPVVKNFGAFFAANDDGAMGPSKITLNFAISKFVSHRNRIPRQFCLRAFVAANFAGNIFRREFRRQNFSPAPIFRRRRFSPAPFFAGSSFRRADPSCCPQKHQLGLAASFFQKGKQSSHQATCMRPVVTGEKSHFYSLIMTITIVIACQPPIPTSKFCSLIFSPVFRSAGWLP